MKIRLLEESIFSEQEIELGNRLTFIYGSNGSGKTMFSRLLAKYHRDSNKFLELLEDKSFYKDLSCKFDVDVSSIVVFNADYVKYYFDFFQSKTNSTITMKILNNEADITSINNEIKQNRKLNREVMFSIKEKFNQHQESLEKVKKEISKIESNIITEFKEITKDKIEGYKKDIAKRFLTEKNFNNLTDIDKNTYDDSITNVYSYIKNLENDPVQYQDIIIPNSICEIEIDLTELQKILSESIALCDGSIISNYIKENKDKSELFKVASKIIKEPICECPLCRSSTEQSKNFLKEYVKYFNNKESQTKEALNKFKSKIDNKINSIKENINKIQDSIVDNNAITLLPIFREEYKKHYNDIKTFLINYKNKLTKIVSEIDEKQKDLYKIIDTKLEDIIETKNLIDNKLKDIESIKEKNQNAQDNSTTALNSDTKNVLFYIMKNYKPQILDLFNKKSF